MRLIDADALKDRVGYIEEEYGHIMEEINNVPTVDAVERKRGRWIPDVAFYDEDGCPCIVSRCSECGEAYPESNFCPNCGAEMRKEGKTNV